MSVDADIANLPLVEAAARIAAGDLSSVEVTQACLGRLAESGCRLNCVTVTDPDAARAAAQQADAALVDGALRGPLHGVPLAHKDMFYRGGRASACGSRILADFVPDHTATVLQRLDRAGAIDIARLHMSELALGATGHNDIMGAARNPWDPARAPGGSSSGSAIAVACGAVYGALGSDTGGSVRQPAAFCGVVGLKPTAGRISRYGMMPLSFTVDSPGIVTRSVADCWLLYTVIAGHDRLDPTTSRRRVSPLPTQFGGSIAGLRVGVPRNYFHESLDGDVSRRVEESLWVLEKLGASIVPVEVPSVELASPLMGIIVAVEAATLHLSSLRERPHDLGAQTRARLAAGLLYPGTSYVEALTLRARLLSGFRTAVFERADVLHAPTMPMTAPTLAESDVGDRPGFADYLARYGHCTRPASYLGLPAITLPAGQGDNGMPCAFQLIGRPFDEESLLRVAAAYEREVGPFPRPPSGWSREPVSQQLCVSS